MAFPSTGAGGVVPPDDLVPPDEPSSSRPWLVAGTVLLLAVVAVVLFLIGANLTSEGNQTALVPTVEELPVDEATSRLEQAGFAVRIVEEPNAEKPRGIVFDQNPSGGTRAAEGSEVLLTVSAGVGQAEVPSVLGFNQTQAESLLRNAGFRADPRPETSPTVPAGEVMAQDPPAGTMADRDSVVVIVVSSGKETVTVPEVAGQSEASAANLLGQRGFQVQSGQDFSSTVPAGAVIRTSPAAGTTVEPGSTVTIVVSAGPEPTTTTSTTPTTTTTVPPSSTSSSTSSTSSTSTP
jgi:serine/threonine-protein kinase